MCIAHQLNLITDKLVKILDSFLAPIKSFRKTIKNSRKFSQTCKNLDVKQTTIANYSPTRWYSMMSMINSYKDLQYVITFFCNFISKKTPPHFITFFDAKILARIFNLLAETIGMIESNTFGMTSQTIFLMIQLRDHIVNEVRCYFRFALLERSIMEVFDFYYQNIISKWYNILLIATLLNPDQKYRSVLSDNEISKGWILLVDELMKCGGDVEELNAWIAFPCTAVSDLFAFWINQRNNFPHLFHVAIFFLGIPVSSSKIERVFSKSGWIMSDLRQNMSPESLKANNLILGNKDLFEELRVLIH